MAESDGTTVMVDREMGVQVIDETGLDLEANTVWDAITGQHPEIAALVRWTSTTQGGSATRRSGGLLERDRYVTPTKPFEQMRTARDAVESDDVVSGIAETTESLAFTRMSFMAQNEEEEDVWNQIAGDLDLDSRLREMWQQLFIYSQFYVLQWFGSKTYKVRGETKSGNARRKTFENLRVPLGLSLLDPMKVMPVGTLMFNQERLAYVADRTEVDLLDAAAANDPLADDLARQIIEKKYEPDEVERRSIIDAGLEYHALYLMNPNNVWRHTATRPQYQRLATVRMKSVFELLDLKQQLRQMDRAHLIGGPLRVDQRIVTPEGWKPIGAAKVGDKVMSVDGRPTEIIGVFPQGVLPMYRVAFTDGAEVYCDPSHPWTVRAPKGEWRTIRLEQILAEGLMQPNGQSRRHRHEIPIAAPVQLPEADLPVDPYLLGYLLGDGHFGMGRTPQIASVEEDRPWEDCLPAGVRSVPQANGIDYALSRVPQGRQRRGEGDRSNVLVSALQEIGVHGLTCRDKYIPERYLWASVAQRWALLQGLADSDGTARVGGTTIGTASEKLADGIVELVQSLGGIAYKREYASAGQPFWQVDCQFDGSLGAPFRLVRKVAVWSSRKRPLRRCIAKVERVEDAEAVCIKTARDDGLFCTEGYVITHNTNFIVLIKKGTDAMPAKPAEIANLQANVRTVAQVPVIVGDHRLSVEIVTPKTDQTLQPDRYNGLDARITARLYQMFMTGNFAAGAKGDDSIKLAKVVGRGMESRRHMLRRAIERHILGYVTDSNEQLSSAPKLRFHPSRIELAFDPAVSAFIMDIRDRGDMSRETYLGEVEIDQADEAVLREREKERFDKLFVPTNVPFTARPGSNPQGPGADGGGGPPNDPRTAGRTQGGRRKGGGAAPGSGQGQEPRDGRPAK